MPDSVGIIGFEFFAHGKNHGTAEQADHTLTDNENTVGDAVFPEVPGLDINKKEIGFAQDA